MRSRTHSFTRGLRRPRSRKYAGPCIFIYISFTIYIYTYARSGRFWKIIYYYYAPRSTLCTRGDFCFARKYPTRLPNFPRASARSNKISRANSPRNRSPPPLPIIDKIMYRIVSRYKFTWLTEQIISIDLEITYRMEQGFGIT